jgi:hypothetical protein
MKDIINGILAALLIMTLLVGMYALYIGLCVGSIMLIICGLIDVIILAAAITFKR